MLNRLALMLFSLRLNQLVPGRMPLWLAWLVAGAGRTDTVSDVRPEILFEMSNSRSYGSEAQLAMPTQGTLFHSASDAFHEF